MISAVILSHNDEHTIHSCLVSLLWCDEIIVLDDYSTDSTKEIIANVSRSHPGKIRVSEHALSGDFSAQRNYGMKQSRGEWIFFVDADERISDLLHQEIKEVLATVEPSVEGFVFRRKDFFCGKWLQHGEIGHYRAIRLARSQVGLWQGTVHETWTVKGKVIPLHHPLQHYPHPDVSSFLNEINYYTDLRAQALYTEKRSILLWNIILYPIGKFLYTYGWQGGFLDGIPGLILACMMSFHSFLVRAKTWQKQQTA